MRPNAGVEVLLERSNNALTPCSRYRYQVLELDGETGQLSPLCGEPLTLRECRRLLGSCRSHPEFYLNSRFFIVNLKDCLCSDDLPVGDQTVVKPLLNSKEE